tara:strand:+ start:38 stop:1870 length:1833 start_codon:yes stop_codon:yes gene_type:complete
MRLSNSDYWDLFICNDCGCSLDQPAILSGDCLIIDIDVNNPHSLTGDSLCSLVKWNGATINSPLKLKDIGLTAIDNGYITYDCTASTTSNTFLNVFTGSTLTLTSANTTFCFTRVTGCTYNYPIEIIDSGTTVGKYAQLCGGFYQGFFKLSDRTFFQKMPDNMFVWPLSWFNCPPCPPCSPPTGNTGTSITCCGGLSNCNCGCNCQLCGTIYAKENVGGCGPSCSCCGGNACDCGCPNPKKAFACYNDKAPKLWNYQILPTRYECGWTAEFWLRRNEGVCSGQTGNTLNTIYPDNEGFFYYMGTRAENKFWDRFSGETGYTTSSGYPLPPPTIVTEEELTNPFLIYQPQGCNCFTGITKVITTERDRNADIVNNALGFRIRSDGSIGYRSIGLTGVCSAVTATTIADCCNECKCRYSCSLCGTIFAKDYMGGCAPGCDTCGTPRTLITGTTVMEKWVTGTTIHEEYSASGIVPDNQWVQVAIRFIAYETYIGCELNGVPRRKGRLDFYVNGYLKYSVHEFDEFLFKDLYEYREKQEGVPFNYSLGGGTQGLLETNTVGGPDPKDENLVIQRNFAGTFYGDLSKFRLYGCCLDITTIRYRFKQLCTDFGIC